MWNVNHIDEWPCFIWTPVFKPIFDLRAVLVIERNFVTVTMGNL